MKQDELIQANDQKTINIYDNFPSTAQLYLTIG